MKIVNSSNRDSLIPVSELVHGRVYVEDEREDTPFIFTDEGQAVDLEDGMMWKPDDSSSYREVVAEVIIG